MTSRYGLPSSSIFYQRALLLPSFDATNAKSWVKAGNCPFRENCKRDSFTVNLESGAFRCRSCKIHGRDVIGFTMKLYGVDFRQALETIRHEWSII